MERIRVFLALLLLTFSGLAGAQVMPQAPDPKLRELLSRSVNQSDSSYGDRFDAQVWLLDMSNRLKKYLPDPQKRLNLLRLVHHEALRAGIKPELVLAVIHTESRFNRFAVSPVGAQGMMQVMPFWKKELGRSKDNLTDIATNLRYGCTILAYYLRLEKGDLTRALGRYNGSLGQLAYPSLVIGTWRKQWYVHR